MYYKTIQFNNNIKKHIIVLKNDDKLIIKKNQYYYLKLSSCKNKINGHIKYWNFYKYKLNPYEYIFNKCSSISKILPVSRSYFKLLELLTDNNILLKYNNVLCLAEAPGGFIQLLNHKCIANNIVGNTLNLTSNKIPSWNKKIKKNNVNLLKGSGDLTDINYLNDVLFKLNKFDLITCDGGIDYSSNYNDQEINSHKLIYSEIYVSLKLLKTNGNLILKIFDIFYNKTIYLLYILYCSFDKIIISKPYTSRPSNSEKYIICINYNLNNENIIKLLETNFKTKNINIKIPDNFYHEILNINKNYTLNQICIINNIIENIKEKNIINVNKNHKNCYEWCKKYKIPTN